MGIVRARIDGAYVGSLYIRVGALIVGYLSNMVIVECHRE
jgi:hypothetical protein